MTFVVDLGTGLASSLLANGAMAVAPTAKNYLAELFERLKDGSLGVFVFGCQGSGKTTLSSVLSGKRTIFDPTNPYVSTAKIEESELGRNRFFSVLDSPGQVRLAEDDWPVLLERLSRTKRAICIYCTAYGHHAPHKTSVSKIADGSAIDFVDYLEDRRNLELQQFVQLVDGLVSYRGKVCFISLTTKQDLWWSQRKEVEKFYAEGPFADQVARLVERKKKDGIEYFQCSVSLSLENLIDLGSNEILAPTTEGYDQVAQAINFKNFSDAFARMTKG